MQELEKCNTNVLDVKNHDMDLPVIQNVTEDLLTRFSRHEDRRHPQLYRLRR